MSTLKSVIKLKSPAEYPNLKLHDVQLDQLGKESIQNLKLKSLPNANSKIDQLAKKNTAVKTKMTQFNVDAKLTKNLAILC